MRIYLAGPEVFLADADAVAAAKRAICAAHGAEGVFPTDPHPVLDAAAAATPAAMAEEAMRLYRRNEAHLRDSDALIANLTPFRGPSADPGTAFELGFMRALGRPVFGYANLVRGRGGAVPGRGGGFAARSLAFLTPSGARRRGGAWEDAEGLLIEDFGLHDNLMLDCGIAASGGVLEVVEVASEAERWRDLTGFARCVALAAGPPGRPPRAAATPRV